MKTKKAYLKKKKKKNLIKKCFLLSFECEILQMSTKLMQTTNYIFLCLRKGQGLEIPSSVTS